ncbi:MAG: hypothetical protein ACTSP9_10090 [Promethearchaeota archaeon]
MAVLEVGINLGSRSLLEVKYYSDSDNILKPKYRAKFLSGLESYVSEVYGDKMNVISFPNFQIVCYYKMLKLASIDLDNAEPLLAYAIIEKGTDPAFVKKNLKEIISKFLNYFPVNEIICEDIMIFKEFEEQIGNILGDLRFKLDDRINTIF